MGTTQTDIALTDISPLAVAIRARQALRERLAEARRELEAETDRQGIARGKVETAADLVRTERGLLDGIAQHQRTTFAQLDARTKERLQELEKGLDAANRVLADAEAAGRALHREIADIEKQLGTFAEASDLKAIIRFQDSIDDSGATIRRLEDAIAKQRIVIDGHGTARDLLAKLEEARAEILGKIALGESDETPLTQVDGRIERARNGVIDADRKVADAEQTIKALTRLLSEAGEKRDELERGRREVLAHLVQNEAARLGEDYVTFAAELVEVFGRLAALDHLARAYREDHKSPRFIGSRASDLLIPAMNLPAFEGKRPGLLFGVFATGELRQEMIASLATHEAARLRDLGIQL